MSLGINIFHLPNRSMRVVPIDGARAKQRLGGLGPAKMHCIEQKAHLVPGVGTVLDSAETDEWTIFSELIVHTNVSPFCFYLTAYRPNLGPCRRL